ncbi:ABC transporter ATP-binding protein [Microtetraspora sp. NBRC 16547]|uniref:ABC transporter ATP-binding protein n=1 Tax=Microtetraspora sp. NBRC 16547 TaxID=3030993 RepID=UPI0024A1F5C7|nr:ABC transporter ATP-binding protein [Microtetraspora sp. NBRC 16547]GLX00473.1 multidrug ABC transporter permease [Microtetraspora sp. NBRC 16547]
MVLAVALAWRSGPLRVLGYLLATLCSAAVPLSVAWLTKLTIDEVAAGTVWQRLAPLAIGLAVVGVISSLMPGVLKYVRTALDRATGLVAQERLFGAVNRLSGLARFEDPAFLDRLQLARQSGGLTPGQVVDTGLQVVRGTLVVGGFLTGLFVMSPLIAGIVVLSALPVLVSEVWLSRRRAAMMWQVVPMQRWEIFYGMLLSDDRAAKEVRLFGLGAWLQNRMLRERRLVNAAQRRMDRRGLAVETCLAPLSAVVAGAGLLWAIAEAGSGRLTPGDVAMFIAAVGGVQTGLAQMAGDVAAAHQQLLLFAHFRAVVDAPQDLPVPERATPVPPLRRGIELKDVWFRYSPDHPWALRGVDVTIPYGAAVALVGRNGAGKSTLVKLLCRFYDPTRGTILWDGVDLRDMDPTVLRRRLGVLFQDFMEYDLTAGENIGLGDLALMDDRRRLEQAARDAGVHEDLAALPGGYDTPLTRVFLPAEEGTGVMLSGGQWQRVALARALLRGDRDLLILDEPSSGLDAESEHAIHTRLRTLRQGRTSVLISHRLNAVRDADHLVVLDAGQVVEQGTHEELMSAGGRYAGLFTLQASGYREPVS